MIMCFEVWYWNWLFENDFMSFDDINWSVGLRYAFMSFWSWVCTLCWKDIWRYDAICTNTYLMIWAVSIYINNECVAKVVFNEKPKLSQCKSKIKGAKVVSIMN
jgi:hypothetical protein